MVADHARRFRIHRCLGRGGFGEVYVASMISAAGVQTQVALKLLRVDLDANRDAARRLRDEARALGRLAHPGVIRVLDLTRLDDRLGIVTELVEGCDLGDVLGGDEGLSVRALLQAVGTVADALAAAHTCPGPDGAPLNLVHRDVKPANIRVGRHGQVKLLDFGIARFESPDREARTDTGVMVGSLPWMAPERFASAEAGPAADVFGLGCIVYQGLAGEPLLPPGNLRARTALALDREAWEAEVFAKLRALSDVPGPLVALIETLTAWRPDARPSAAEVARRCDRLADELSGLSLRRWCAQRTWPTPPPVRGSLSEGVVLTEETLALTGGDPRDRSSEGPRVVTEPPATLDPSVFEEEPSVARRPTQPPTPDAPPAFPSIPLGMALDRNQISEDQVEEMLGEGLPSSEPTEEMVPPDAPPPVQSSSGMSTMLAVGGCLVLVGVALATFVALAGIAMLVISA